MNQTRTIIGACDYSLATLQQIKKTLMDYGNKNQEINLAVGGVIVTLTSHLLKICHEVFISEPGSAEANARDDIKAIKSKFNSFIDRMINDN